MSSDAESVKKSIRTYMMVGAALYVFTVITVAINQVHLTVPLAIALGLLVATTKGSMVAAIFMHLNHERWWVYGSLIITVIFFAAVLLLPVFAQSDHLGTLSDWAAAAGHAAGHAAESGGH